MKKLICALFALCFAIASSFADESVSPAFDPAHYEGKLAIWFFSLPGEDHTGESMQKGHHSTVGCRYAF